MWLYVSRGLFVQKAKAGEVGSSTMPHKVNPIHFENAEGNLQLSNAQLAFLGDKLQKSRMQRDLSDSTVSRNVGAALAHHVLAYEEVQVGLSRVALSEEACRKALEATPELLAEPIQTILRLHVDDDPYKRLLELTRGRAIGPAEMRAFVDGLDVEHGVKEQLRALEVTSYLGDAGKIARKVLAMAEEAFGS
jgi:adenylosuccinate lyase